MLICHISDIHFKKDLINPVIYKTTKLAEAIGCNMVNDFQMIIVISGDIAYSGYPEEYSIALDFLIKLEEEIKSITGKEGMEFHYVMVPGNHDCILNVNNEIRKVLLENVKSKQEASNDIIEQCKIVQRNFFDFYETFIQRSDKDTALCILRELNIDNKKLLFQSFNTAWMSTIPEKQGELIFPENQLPRIESNNYDIVFSLFHHPLNWLESNNKRKFKEYIEKTSDIIITGHEHLSETVSVETDNLYENKYFSGGVLQVSEENMDSSFNIINIDLLAGTESFCEYKWNGEMYIPQKRRDAFFKRNKYIEKQEFTINDIFMSYLNEIGLNLTHTKKETLNLEDIFLYPNIKVVLSKIDKDRLLLNGQSKNYIMESKRVVIVGEEKSGKSSLGKMLYKNLFKEKIIPILIDANKFKSIEEDKIKNTINKVFCEQYDSVMLEKYKQLSKNKKAIIIDDFNKIGLNDKGQKIILQTISNMFDYVIIFSDQTFILNTITKSHTSTIDWNDYSVCEIIECGHAFRCELVQKWNQIGINEMEIIDSHTAECISVENQINTAMGKNLLPKYPVYILLILQQLESSKSANTNFSTYGYLYEALIMKDLFTIRQATDDIDMYSTFLSELAYYIFNNKPEVLDREEINKVIETYNTKYKMKLSFEDTIKKLIDVRILKEYSNRYSFKHDFAYYYFVATFIQKEFEDGEGEIYQEVKAHIIKMSNKLLIETNSNIILFLCHLSKNTMMINAIIENAKEIFNAYEPYNLGEQGKGIKELYDKIPKILLPETKPDENRKRSLNERDKRDYESLMQEEKEEKIEENEDDELNRAFEISKAFKTLQILGQIVKNYPGSLKADMKNNAITECYNLGARTINVFMSIVDNNINEIIEDLTQMYIDRIKISNADNRDARDEAKHTIFRICEMVLIGIIKKVSGSVNNDKLNETYKDILSQNQTVMFELIDLSIKLDSLKAFPEKDVITLNDKLEKNYFARSILILLVSQHFYLYECEYSVKQRICQKLGISYQKLQIEESRQLKIKKLN